MHEQPNATGREPWFDARKRAEQTAREFLRRYNGSLAVQDVNEMLADAGFGSSLRAIIEGLLVALVDENDYAESVARALVREQSQERELAAANAEADALREALRDGFVVFADTEWAKTYRYLTCLSFGRSASR